MAEGVDYEDLEDFENKLGIIKEQYFASTSVIKEQSDDDEEPLDEGFITEQTIDPEMKKIADAITRTASKQ
jgi:hypothetical protein